MSITTDTSGQLLAEGNGKKNPYTAKLKIWAVIIAIGYTLILLAMPIIFVLLSMLVRSSASIDISPSRNFFQRSAYGQVPASDTPTSKAVPVPPPAAAPSSGGLPVDGQTATETISPPTPAKGRSNYYGNPLHDNPLHTPQQAVASEKDARLKKFAIGFYVGSVLALIVEVMLILKISSIPKTYIKVYEDRIEGRGVGVYFKYGNPSRTDFLLTYDRLTSVETNTNSVTIVAANTRYTCYVLNPTEIRNAIFNQQKRIGQT